MTKNHLLVKFIGFGEIGGLATIVARTAVGTLHWKNTNIFLHVVHLGAIFQTILTSCNLFVTRVWETRGFISLPKAIFAPPKMCGLLQEG